MRLSNPEFAELAAQPPPDDALAWVGEIVGAGSNVISAKALPGGTATAIHALRVRDMTGGLVQLVLKRFIRADWVEREPDIVMKEARALEIVASIDVRTPPLVAVDSHGRTCDVPAILMERLPGQVELNPPNRDAWVARLAEPLALIHTLHSDLYREVPAYAPYNDVTMLTPPAWSRDPGMWSRVFHLLQGQRPGEKVVFLHRDYHPTNVLWYRGEVSGVLDWTNACRGPVGVDVGHCRLNLVQIFGLDVAAKFLNEYCAATGHQHHPYWDLLTAIDCLPLDEVYPGWQELGARDLTIDVVRERLEAYVSAVLQRIW